MGGGRTLGVLRERCGGSIGSVGHSRGVRGRESRAAAIRSAPDDVVIGVRVLHRGVKFAPDPEAVAGRHPVQGVGGGQRAGLRNDLGLSQDPHRDAAGIIRAGLGDGAGGGSGQNWAGHTGRHEGEANASKHKAMSYGRMQEKQEQLRDEVKQLLEQAEAADEEEDRRYGSQRGDELPEELRRRETRLAKIKIAKKVVEQRAREKAAAEGKSAAEAKRAKPDDKDQYNFTDPESRIMKGADGLVQGYNAQVSVEPEMLLIVGQAVTEAANDKQQLEPMVEAIEQQSGQRPEAILADSGYCSEENLAYLESADQPERKIDGYIATGKQKHGEHRLPCKRGPLPKGATKVDRMKRKLQTKVGKAVYAARKCVVEPVFGQIKQARGFRQFLLRGKDKVKGEWALVCLTHNILRLHAAMQPR